jgi:hypothetical protein
VRSGVKVHWVGASRAAATLVASLVAKSGYAALGDGLAIKQYVKAAEDDGEQLQLPYWEAAVSVDGSGARLAIFSYTILASQAKDRQIQQEIELLDRCIRAGQFSREQGMPGDCQHE